MRLDVIAGIPGLLVAALVAVLILMWMAGVPPVQAGRTMTLAEAAALEDEADILRLIRAGADPNAPGFVRRTRLRSVNHLMTPLEAAVATRDAGMMRVMVEWGAVIDEGNFPVLWCFAEQRQNREVLAYLRARRPDRPAADCAGVHVPAVTP